MNTIISGSANHSCLQSFLRYARRNSLNPQSTVYLGTRYEYVVARALKRLGFSLVRVGKGGDGGIDLLGEWSLPALAAEVQLSRPFELEQVPKARQIVQSSPIRVLLQCKRYSRRLSPEYVRELEGAFAGMPAAWRADKSTIGFLVTPHEASKGVLEAVQRSRMPLGFIALEEQTVGNDAGVAGRPRDYVEELGGRVTQFMWNWKAQEMRLQGLGVTWRHIDSASPAENQTASELTLTWNGRAMLQDELAAQHTPESASSLTADMSLRTINGEQESIVRHDADQTATPPKRRGRPRKTKNGNT